MNRTTVAVVLVVALALSPAGVAVAQTLTHPATAGVTYETTSGVEVTLGDNRDVTAQPFVADSTWSDGTLTVSGSNGTVRVDDTSYAGDPLEVRNVQATGSVTVSRSDIGRSVTFESGDASLFQLRDYAIGDGTEDLAYASDNGVTVRLEGLDQFRVAAVDVGTGEPLDIGDATGDGTATLELPAGQRAVRLERAPGILEVRNEANPNELIDGNATLRVRLFASGDTVVEREVTDGTVSLDGVPKDERLVITVREENADFAYRRILIESAVQSPNIYLLPTDQPSAEVRYQLRDDTGRFDADNTRLFVEKPITRDRNGDGTNTTEYEVISGDRFGADGEFPTILVDSERYRLRVVNDAGEQRVLGSYTVQGARITELPIGDVEFTADVSEGAAMQASLRQAAETASHDYEARIVYVDPEAQTSEIDVSVTDDNGTAIRPTTTETISGSEPYVETYPITDSSFDPEQDSATVSVEATRGSAIEQFSQPIGDVPDVNVPVDQTVLELVGLVSIVAVAGLLVIVSPAIAGLVTPGYAGLLALTGIVPIPIPAVVLAGVVGVLASLGSATGRL